ncbi:MAG: 4Fe-4S binding protein [Actinobacteria bacterium]|nr:4Fe-4S binding protein [Actinomycetota bacterium]
MIIFNLSIPIGKVGIDMSEVPSFDLTALKSGGFIKQIQPDLFAIRLRVPVGDIKSNQLAKVAEIAEKYGQGILHLTVRQGVEIPYINFKDFESVKEELAGVGLNLGACGARVRVVTGCPGLAVCPQGMMETKNFGKKLDDRYFGRGGIPHKFKMGITGCPNSCAKPQENDLGFMGVVEPLFDESDGCECISCGLCEEVCPSGAIKMVEGKPVIDLSICLHDAECIKSCPTGSIRRGRTGWNVFVGGKWGKHPQLGVLFKEFVSNEEGLELVENILKAYTALADKKERLGALINRIGLEKFKEEVADVSS